MGAPSFSIVIIGGGLAATSTAYFLAAAGESVGIIDAHNTTSASSNPASILMPLITHAHDQLGLWYLRGYEKTLEHLSELGAPDAQVFSSCGVMDINPEHTKWSIEETCLTADHVETTHFRDRRAFYFKRGGYVDTQKLCQLQQHHCASAITHISQDAACIKLEKNHTHWSIYDRNGAILAKSAIVIVANGWNCPIFEQTAWLPITAIKGQVAFYQEPIVDLEHVLVDEGYITPYLRHINAHAIGATYRRHVTDNVLTEEEENELITKFDNTLSLNHSSFSLAGWSGVRSATPDRRAIVGPVPIKQIFLEDFKFIRSGAKPNPIPKPTYYPGLYVNTGHGSRGLTSCIISGYYLSQLILANGEDIPFALNKLLYPERFLVRQIKKGMDG